MTTYEQTFDFTLAGAGVAIVKWQNNCSIRKIVGVHLAGTQFTASFYNRAFSWTAKNLLYIRTSGGKCLVAFAEAHRLAVGDSFTIASSGVGGYNTTHKVTSIVDESIVVTSVNYSADVNAAGTGALAVPTAEKPLYKVLADKQSSSGGLLEHFEPSGYAFFNQDPPSGRGAEHYLYIYCDQAGSYRFSVAGTADLS